MSGPSELRTALLLVQRALVASDDAEELVRAWFDRAELQEPGHVRRAALVVLEELDRRGALGAGGLRWVTAEAIARSRVPFHVWCGHYLAACEKMHETDSGEAGSSTEHPLHEGGES